MRVVLSVVLGSIYSFLVFAGIGCLMLRLSFCPLLFLACLLYRVAKCESLV